MCTQNIIEKHTIKCQVGFTCKKAILFNSMLKKLNEFENIMFIPLYNNLARN